MTVRRNPLAAAPWWSRVVLGAVVAALGVVLLANPTATIDFVVLLAGLAFLASGCALVLAGPVRGRSGAGSNAVAATASIGTIAVAVAFVAVGIVVLVWRDITVQWLAVIVGVALILSGVVGVFRAFVPGTQDRFAATVFALAGISSGVLLLSWPRLGLPVIGLVLGGWLIYCGLAMMVDVVVRLVLDRRGRGARTSGGSIAVPSAVPTSAAPSAVSSAAQPFVRPSTVQPRRDPRAHRPRFSRWLRGISAVAVLAVTVALLAGTAALRAGDPRIIPDAFYTPPVTVPAEPGQLIRAEPLSASETVTIPAGTVAWRILYTTTNPDGGPAVSSGTVIAPADMPDGDRPVVAVAHGTTGIVPGCAPSVSAAPFGDGAASALEGLVADGWVGVISDYVGLGTAGPHRYLVGEAEARNVLDSVRAANRLDGLQLANSVAVWGHSQGGHGALWTGIIAPDYAPEINLIGVAAMAPATDLYSLADGVKDSAAGKIVSAYIAASWNEVYPELHVEDLITPRYRALVDQLGEQCFSGKGVLASASITTQMFDAIFVDSALDGALGDELRANSPIGPIGVPVLIAQGGSDSLVLPAMQERWVADRCATGQSLDFRVFPGLDHLPLVAADSPLTPQLVAWTTDRLAAAEPTPTC